MNPAAHAAPAWTALLPLVAVGLVILRNARARSLQVERLWIAPVMILAVTVLTLSRQGMPGPGLAAVEVAALVLGGFAGWWRGRLTRITVDPASHQLTSQTSPWGMLLILTVFAVRWAVRAYAGQGAGALHVDTLAVTDALMLFAVGLVCAQRLEIALRATRLLAAARAGRASE